MTNKSIILSSSGIKNILEDENEFTFIFGEQEIVMNNNYSEFISPIVSRLHHSDPTIDRFQFISAPKSSKLLQYDLFKEDILTLLKELSIGNKIALNDEQLNKLRFVSIFIGNDELFSQLNELQPIDSSDIDKLLELIEIIEITKFQNSNEYDSLFDSISNNFHNIKKEKLLSLRKTVFYKLITNRHLKIESEDSLFEIINEFFYTNDRENKEDESLSLIDFYEKIDMKNLSDDKFNSLLHKIDRNEITGEFWTNLLKRFTNNIQRESENQTRYIENLGKSFLFDGKDENKMNGIIRFLTNESGGNVHDKGYVNVSASSECSSGTLAKFAVDLDNKGTRFRSNDEKNSFLQYDFKERKVRPTHYSIRSKPFEPGDLHPQNWVIEGSNTGKNDWKIIDTRTNVTVLNDKSVTHTFDIQEKLERNEFFRFLRIRQTGKNANGSYYLGFSALEYFGSLI